MKKTTILLLTALFVSTTIFAQTTDTTKSTATKAKEKVAQSNGHDRLVIDLLSYNNWYTKNLPAHLTKSFGAGFNFYFYYDVVIKKSRFSVAPGIGISYADVIMTNQLIKKGDSTSITGYTAINTATGAPNYDVTKTNFVPFAAANSINRLPTRDVLSTLYLDIPVELRYRSKPDKRNKSVKVAIGFKAGVLVDDHTKLTDEGPDGHHEVIKTKNYTDLNRFRYGPTFRIGYGPFNVFGYYSVGQLFGSNGPQTIYPFSVGVSINGL